jgi:hypothetical protein
MNENDALTTLRSTVSQFDRSERLALATLLTTQCNPRFREVTYAAYPPFKGWLNNALLAAGDFPQTAKLAFAIELLQHQLSEDEEDTVDTDPYGYETPAIDEDEDNPGDN